MNIGIDIHGTINSDIKLFTNAMKYLVSLGDRIYIISGPPLLQIKEELDNLGLKLNEHYHNIISVVNFLKNNKVKMWQDEKGHWWCDEEIWWKSKARICMMYEINIIIDDKKEYQEHFKNTNILFYLWKSDEKLLTTELPYEKHIDTSV